MLAQLDENAGVSFKSASSDKRTSFVAFPDSFFPILFGIIVSTQSSSIEPHTFTQCQSHCGTALASVQCEIHVFTKSWRHCI